LWAHGRKCRSRETGRGKSSLFGGTVDAQPNDELDFARQINVLMDDPELRERMNLVAKERVENELAWPHQLNHLLDAYESIVASKGVS
jgi:glycosyltransferase involved in cell wall biosynthesis